MIYCFNTCYHANCFSQEIRSKWKMVTIYGLVWFQFLKKFLKNRGVGETGGVFVESNNLFLVFSVFFLD